ncbi:MAG: putative ligase [Bacteroidetes bacterium]|nr:putative ligase [Bacteroidota bacterium]
MSKKLEIAGTNISHKDLSIIGIMTSLSSFSLAQTINSNFQTNLKLLKDFECWDNKAEETHLFKHYYYFNEQLKLHNILIKNKNSEDVDLFTHANKYNYIFVFVGRDHSIYSKEFIDCLGKVENINSIKQINPFEKPKPEVASYDLFDNPIVIKPKKTSKLKSLTSKKDDIPIIHYNMNQFVSDLDFYLENLINEKRLFVAFKVRLNDKLLSVVNNFKAEFKEENLKLTELENIHVTLVFLGSTANKKISNIEIALIEAIGETKEIEIEIESLNYFEQGKISTIWFGIKENEILDNLVKKINYSLDKEKINYCKRINFIGHVTIAKVKKIKNKNKLESRLNTLFNIEPQKIIIENPTLFESITLDNATRYDIVRVF